MIAYDERRENCVPAKIKEQAAEAERQAEQQAEQQAREEAAKAPPKRTQKITKERKRVTDTKKEEMEGKTPEGMRFTHYLFFFSLRFLKRSVFFQKDLSYYWIICYKRPYTLIFTTSD